MKKISAILLVVLCVLTLSSCVSSGFEKAPSWLRGKTWTGEEIFFVDGESFPIDISFTFYDNGMFRVEDYLEEIPEGMIVSASGNSKSYQLSFVGTFVYEGVTYDIEAVYTFTKVSDNECDLNSNFKSGEASSSTSYKLSAN